MAWSLVAIHAGTVVSYRIAADANALHIFFKAQFKEGVPDRVIRIEGGSPVELFCPSVEGIIIWCALKSGEERFYDTRTGERLTVEKVEAGERAGKIHFYS